METGIIEKNDTDINFKLKLPIHIEIIDGNKAVTCLYLTQDVYSKMSLEPYYFEVPYKINEKKYLAGLQIINGMLNSIYTNEDGKAEFEKVNFYLY